MQRAFPSVWIARTLVAFLSVAAGAARQNSGLPAGTRVEVRLLNQLDTEKAQVGQTFSATVATPVVTGGKTVLASGAKVSGRVLEAVSSGRLKRPASLTLELTQAGGSSLATEPLRIDGKSHLLRNVAIIGGESVAGAIIGGATAGKKGAAIGAAIGAGAGTATAYMTGKKEIVLPVETALTFVVAGGSPAGTTSAEARGARQLSTSPSQTRERAGAAQEPLFSDRDRRLIRRYFARQTGNLPPGLAKRGGHLPPGLERHLERDGTLPPGLQKRVEPFPEDLESELPRLRPGYTRVILGGRALILDANSRIADLMSIRRGENEQGEDEDRGHEDRDKD